MYAIVLSVVLTAGGAPVGDTRDAVEDLRRAVEELKKGQVERRVEELNLVIAGLREQLLEQKLDEVRRDIVEAKAEQVRYRMLPLHAPVMPRATAGPSRAVITLRVPAGATFSANDQVIALPSANPTFVTPPLAPGRDYYYDFKVTVTQDGKTITRVKRVTVRDGAEVRLAYEDMDVR